MEGSQKRRYYRLLMKVAIAILVALLFVFLGQFEGVGYNVHSIRENSFIPDYYRGYANASFEFEATYDPLLYPFYWIAGRGYVSGDFSMVYLPHSYFPGEFGPPIYGDSPEDRYGNYVSYMITWGTYGNFAVLLTLTMMIEMSRRRAIYILLFFGILGFSFAGAIGTVGGLIIGALAMAYVLKRGYAIPLAGLKGYILRRIIYSFMLVILVITLDFLVFMAMPGNPMNYFFPKSETTSQEQRGQWGMDQPMVPQYFTYLRNLLSWNLGKVGKAIDSTHRDIIPVVQGLVEKLPYTALILGISSIVAIILGIYLGVLAIHKRGRVADSMTIFLLMVSSLPVWWIGIVMLSSLCYNLGWFPIVGGYPRAEWANNPPVIYKADLLYSPSSIHMVYQVSLSEFLRLIGGYAYYAFLPICAEVLFMLGTWVLLTRASLMQTIGEEYLVTAKAKGVKEWRIWTKHALSNAYLPLITSAALSFGFLFTGSMLVETVFRYPGVGVWLYDAMANSDYPVLMTLFYVIALSVIIANTIADFLYGILDPRIKTGQQAP